MKVRINPDGVAENGGNAIRGKLFGKPVVSGETYDLPKTKTKMVKSLTMVVNGRKMPMWVEVKPAATEK